MMWRTYYSSTSNLSVTVQHNSFVNKSLGDWSDGGTPGYIPNPAVKSVSADGTWRATSWESRSLPRGFSFNKNIDFASVCESCIIILQIRLGAKTSRFYKRGA